MSVEFTIICNECVILGDSSRVSAARARAALREDRGWRVALPGGIDLCEGCKEQGAPTMMGSTHAATGAGG